MKLMRIINSSIVLILFLLIGISKAESSDEFAWLDPVKNVELFREIQKAFSDELQPYIPGNDGLDNLKIEIFIAKLGVYRESCLVLIGYRYF